MKFGVDLYPHFTTELDGPTAFKYALRQVQTACEVGFDGIFASHHYLMGPSEQMFQPIPLLGRLAAEAQGMTLGTAVFLLSLHNPVEAAELSSTMDIISEGRFVFGVGQGYREAEFSSFGISRRNRGGRLEEAVQVVRKLWAEEDVTWDGEHFQLDGVTVAPRPVQQPGPPIWVGGDTLAGVERAARIGDAWLTSPRHSKTFIREAIERFKRTRTNLGQDSPPPVFFREMYVAPTRQEAEEEIRESFERLYHAYHRAGQPGERYDLRFQELRDERLLVGNPDDVVAEIDRYRQEFGAEYMFFRLYYLGMDPENSVRCIRLFGEEVIPQIG